MTSKYRTRLFERLHAQICSLETADQRLGCSVRAEKLRDELKDGMTYSPTELAECVLRAPVNFKVGTRVKGNDARRDLLQLIDDLASEIIVPIEEAPEPVYTLEELAKRWSVSTKTVVRWRERGLTGRTFVIDGRRRVGFLRSSADRFAKEHPTLVRRGSRFSRVTEDERQHILRRGREMLDGLVAPSEVVSRLHIDTQRSAETIRQLLGQADLLDRGRMTDLSERAKQRLFREFRRGNDIDALARRYELPVSTVRLAINRLRVERIRQWSLDFMPSDEFTRRGAEQRILAPTPQSSAPARMPRKPADLPAYIASLYEVPLLTAEQETHLFRKYNFLKYKAARLRETLNPQRPSSRTLDQIEQLYEQAIMTNNELVRANLRLVVAVAKKYVGPHGDLFEKVSEGNVSLLRAVEKFDYTRGFKFSTYATWAIKKNYIRAYANAAKQGERFRTGHEEILEASVAYRANPQLALDAQRKREQQVAEILQDLSDRERDIIRWRFGMEPGAEPKTLKQVGEKLGVSKERVRQLETRAMKKLREAATQAHFEDADTDDELAYQTN